MVRHGAAVGRDRYDPRGVELMAENASSLAWSMWAGAFEAAGLDVDVPERSATELDVPLGSIGQFVDDDTGATVFVSLDEVRREDGEADEDDLERVSARPRSTSASAWAGDDCCECSAARPAGRPLADGRPRVARSRSGGSGRRIGAGARRR